jgi:DNA-binding NtrC family response regulator
MTMTRVLLLVDDDPAMLAYMRPLFVAAGYVVESAENGVQARRLLERRHVDAVITDLYMPDEDGFEVLQFCQRERPGLPVVVVTGRDTAPFDPLPMARRFGAVAALRKPVMPEVLLETVRRALNPDAEEQARQLAERRSAK